MNKWTIFLWSDGPGVSFDVSLLPHPSAALLCFANRGATQGEEGLLFFDSLIGEQVWMIHQLDQIFYKTSWLVSINITSGMKPLLHCKPIKDPSYMGWDEEAGEVDTLSRHNPPSLTDRRNSATNIKTKNRKTNSSHGLFKSSKEPESIDLHQIFFVHIFSSWPRSTPAKVLR